MEFKYTFLPISLSTQNYILNFTFSTFFLRESKINFDFLGPNPQIKGNIDYK